MSIYIARLRVKRLHL